MSGVFCTNNAQAPSLFSNVTLTSRRTKLIVCLLVSVTLEKRERICAMFVQKTPDMFTNLPTARKTLLKVVVIVEKIIKSRRAACAQKSLRLQFWAISTQTNGRPALSDRFSPLCCSPSLSWIAVPTCLFTFDLFYLRPVAMITGRITFLRPASTATDRTAQSCTRFSDQNVYVTSRGMWEFLFTDRQVKCKKKSLSLLELRTVFRFRLY